MKNVNKTVRMKYIKIIGILGGIIIYILLSWKTFFKISKNFGFYLGVLLLVILILYCILLVKSKTKTVDRNELAFLYEYLGILTLVLVTLFISSFMEGNIFSPNQSNPFSFFLILIVMWIISFIWGFQIWLKIWYATFFIFTGIFVQIWGIIILQFYKSFSLPIILLYSGGKITSLLGLVIIPQIKLKSFLKERNKEKDKWKN